jgi:hypothetical protein
MVLLGVKAEVKAHFGLFGDNANLTQDRCTVCTECIIGLEIVLDAPDGILGDEAHVEACFGLFGDSANLDARWVHDFHRTYHRLRDRFRHTRWNYYVTCITQNPVSVHLDTVFVLVQDRRTAYTSETILDAPVGTPRCRD